jgi:hypothetical protein
MNAMSPPSTAAARTPPTMPPICEPERPFPDCDCAVGVDVGGRVDSLPALVFAFVLVLVFVGVLVCVLEMGSVAVPVDARVEDVAVWFVMLVYFTQHWMLFGPGQGQGY